MFHRSWKPSDLDALRKDIDRLWERVKVRTSGGAWTPALDLVETPEALVIRAEVPGISPQAIDVSLAGHVLTIRGERRRESEEKESVILSETDTGRFVRRVELPVEVDPAMVRAEYHNGMLRITLPKSREAREHEVKIEVG